MRVEQPKAKHGSQKWIQVIINACPELLTNRIQKKIISLSGREISWTSPLEQDHFAEYRDAAFLKNIHLEKFIPELMRFWPKNGPQWDALGKTSGDREALILVEGKANVPELVSFCGAKDKKSLDTIFGSLAETRRWLSCRGPRIDWKYGFYQYANRLAHLYFLREKVHKEAYLVFLYFIGDPTHISTSQEVWNSTLKLQKQLMGISAKSLKDKVIDVFVSIEEIESFLATGN